MIIHEVFEVRHDTSERHDKITGYFVNKDDAHLVAGLPIGWYGGTGRVKARKIRIFETAEECGHISGEIVEKEKEKALQKLSRRERQLLGLAKP